jgi:hypothetical protein
MLKRGQYLGSELVTANGAAAIVTVCQDGSVYVGTWGCSCGASAERAFGHHIYASAMEIAKADCVDHLQLFHSS